jgi:TolB-like protein
VKLAALSSLTHLVLGGMVKAKGNMAKVAALLVDDEQGKHIEREKQERSLTLVLKRS